MHVKCLPGADDLDDEVAEELDGSDSEADDIEIKALLVELHKLVAQAGDWRAPKSHAGAWCAGRACNGGNLRPCKNTPARWLLHRSFSN
jgi:hypothetical protein